MTRKQQEIGEQRAFALPVGPAVTTGRPTGQDSSARSFPSLRHCAVVYGFTVVLPAGMAALLLVRSGGQHPAAVADTLPVAAPLTDPSDRLLLATAVVVALAALLGVACRVLRLSPVIGEIAAGLLLGPTVLGTATPSLERQMFPAGVVSMVSAVSQLGVVFFMFIVGIELPLGMLRRVRRRAVVVGHASIAIPLGFGMVLGLSLQHRYWPAGVSERAFLAFVALSMSVTAFPVLARILQDTELQRTPVGVTALAAAGFGDVTAWCLLAIVVAEVRNTSQLGVIRSITSTCVFAAAMWFVGRPVLSRALRMLQRRGRGLSAGALIAGFVLGCASLTYWLGVHAIFGAFLAGLVMPRGSALVRDFRVAIEGFTLWVLLPLFFAAIGLQSHIELVFSRAAILPCVAVLTVAITSKTFAAGVAGRLSGVSRTEALALGIMMNCRGLTELVVLALGRSLGIIGTELFSILVLMTLVTTAMTDPLLRVLDRRLKLRNP
ncbi:MAG TPA: cation:proton antiporter [Jatrophihabitans sp.]|nr:cation:proton antiporter [Jatrophihabitans sp.]